MGLANQTRLKTYLMATSDQPVDTCNALLRGEISATETYSQALGKFVTSPEVQHLSRIRSDHEESAVALREHILECGGEPSTGSGIWG